MTGWSHFAELVGERARLFGDTDAYRFVWSDRDTPEPDRLTYRELDLSARRIAGRLQRSGGRQLRVLIVQGSGRRFTQSLFGCWYAGGVAIPMPPSGGRHQVERMQGVLKSAQVDVVLTDSACAPEVSQHLAWAGQGQIECLAVDTLDTLDTNDAGLWRRPELAAEDIALIQYTSGTTGEPKGVAVTHGNLMANQAAISRAFGTHAGTTVGGWLPLHHDMGLIGQLLHSVWLGGTGVLMPPWVFVRRPVRWLELISDHGITASAAPDFGYALCVREVGPEEVGRLDLSRWETAVVGAEPVRARTLRAFAERFAPAGFRARALRPAYGLAEATLLVSAAGAEGPRERRADPAVLESGELADPAPGTAGHTLVSSGKSAAGRLRIVDPQRRTVLPDGRVGEIWTRGEGVGAGYWRSPLETRHTFGATTADGATGFLRTGDLGLMADGELYVTGRLKDLLIMDGRNLYPHDLEQAVHEVSPLCGAGAVFGVQSDREHVIVVQEVSVRGGADQDFDRLCAAVQDRLADDFSVMSASVVLVRPGTIRRTTSGKIQRDRVRRLFLSGSLDPLHERLAAPVRELLPRTHDRGRGTGGVSSQPGADFPSRT